MIKLPKQFLDNMKVLLKDDFNSFLDSYNEESVKAIRVNTKKTTYENLKSIMGDNLGDKVPYANAFYIDSDQKLGNSIFHYAGLFYVQEPSAMQPVLSATIKEDSIVLDMCASPGGKSGQIAELLNDDGLLVANEIITNRAKILKENMDRLGYKNVIVTSTPPENLTRLGNIFDVIILDAPCSGEGLFRRAPQACDEWNSGINEMNSVRQLEILGYAKKLLKPNGVIIYSTCTFSQIENENVVETFLKENGDFKLLDINKNLLPYSFSLFDEKMRRVMPHKNKGEGQFYACLKNTEEYQIDVKCYNYLEDVKKSESKFVNDFISTYTTLGKPKIKSYNGNILLPPKKEINTKGLFVLKYGITLGKIEKNRFVPHHNFFTSLSDYFKNKVNLNEENAIKYLSGEQVVLSDNLQNGYCVVCYQGFALGGGKITDGRINNLYPKYLRIN